MGESKKQLGDFRPNYKQIFLSTNPSFIYHKIQGVKKPLENGIQKPLILGANIG